MTSEELVGNVHAGAERDQRRVFALWDRGMSPSRGGGWGAVELLEPGDGPKQPPFVCQYQTRESGEGVAGVHL